MNFSGPVIHGLKNGRKMGFPTANIQTEAAIEAGVYVGKATFQSHIYNCIVFVGKSETFNIKKSTYEVHFLHDFNGLEFYNEIVEVDLLVKTRNNKKFDSLDDLKATLEQDKQEAFTFFSQNSKTIQNE
ncbi:Riboflavin_kinase [Hexamita inflata]|uniref:riboflavin kinase n=1 Tax=Hexamita inflata TaxID=28002 RepID=A0AA86R6D0_9EUKA|nr:Riboflavin kinase [Hexamita inflata]